MPGETVIRTDDSISIQEIQIDNQIISDYAVPKTTNNSTLFRGNSHRLINSKRTLDSKNSSKKLLLVPNQENSLSI